MNAGIVMMGVYTWARYKFGLIMCHVALNINAQHSVKSVYYTGEGVLKG